MRELFLSRLDVDAGGIQRGMSQQTRETDEIPWVGGKVAGGKGMAEPVGTHLCWEASAATHQIVNHPSHGGHTERAALLTDPEWAGGMRGPGTSDRLEGWFDPQKRSNIPGQGRPRTRVEGNAPRFVTLATADECGLTELIAERGGYVSGVKTGDNMRHHLK